MLILPNMLEEIMDRRIEVTITKETTCKDPHADEFAVVELIHQLKAYIYGIDPAIEFDNKDFFASNDYSKEKEQITYTLRWLPQTRMCVFYGGPAHGRVVDCENQFPDNITVAKLPSRSLDPNITYFPDADVPTKQIAYKLNDWDTVNRWWIYTPLE